MTTDACGSGHNSPTGKLLPFEVRYTALDGVDHIAGNTIDPEAVDLIGELTKEWVKLWVIDTRCAPPVTVKTIEKEAIADGE